ncbi:11358_t:CDS:2 [Ambispora gerdemannii]|uniref:11358_t:CDS:1 n=1 Tax=Ambispora gerdemannii TaxID=144530 RepID=A0A9N9AYI2_9GLOM|nr:11358_t:CDS:2 [Ambispora gerdemannii]
MTGSISSSITESVLGEYISSPSLNREEPRNNETQKRKKRDNSSIVWDYFKTETITNNRNMLSHLWTKYRIDKDHPEEMTTNGSIVKVMHIITKRRQQKLSQLLIEFIIQDCQPLNILRNPAFRQFVNNLEVGFQIPCKVTAKKMIDQAYNWSHD